MSKEEVRERKLRKMLDLTRSDLREECICETLRKKIGKRFKVERSLDYPHGKMKSGELLKVLDGMPGLSWAEVSVRYTFSDGFKADYVSPARGFVLDYWEQIL